MLKWPNSRACALETTASFLALPVPCVPGPRGGGRARPRGPGDEDEYYQSLSGFSINSVLKNAFQAF